MADKSFRGFGKRANVIADLIGDNVEKLMRRTGLAVDGSLVQATPVDTGRARSNWYVTLGAPISDTRPAYVEGKEGSTAGPNARAALEQARSTLKGYKEGDTIFISNNLAYIEPLNNGWSAQAPAGFVQMSLNAAVETIRDSRLLSIRVESAA